MSISSEQLALLRLSNPAAAFAVLLKDFSRAVEDDCEMTGAFASFQRSFRGPINTAEDARRLDVLKTQGADKLGISVGSLPLAMSAGLAFMYDTTVEALRSSDVRIEPRMFNARAIRTAERLVDIFLLQIGSMNVTALELALHDEHYADRLRQRADELARVAKLEGIVLAPKPPGSPCEYCIVEVKDKAGNTIDVYCPTEEECKKMADAIIILILGAIVLGVLKLFDVF